MWSGGCLLQGTLLGTLLCFRGGEISWGLMPARPTVGQSVAGSGESLVTGDGGLWLL